MLNTTPILAFPQGGRNELSFYPLGEIRKGVNIKQNADSFKGQNQRGNY